MGNDMQEDGTQPLSGRIEQAREPVAKLAEADGEIMFAREVRQGAWDHRGDIQAALRGERLRGEAE